MRPKFVIGITLAVAAIAILGFWLRRPLARPVPVVATKQQPVLPTNSAFSRSIPMVTVIKPGNHMVRSKQSLKFNPKEDDWSDVRLIVDNNADYFKRLEAIKRLPSNLTDADWRVLRGFLLKPDVLDSDQLGQVLKNDIMDKLCLMNPMPNGLEDVLTEMYRNQEQNEVIRDYAVQHLATFDQNLPLQKSNVKTRQAVQKTLWGALDETGDSIAGTALLGLERISAQNPGQVNQKKIGTAALQLADSQTAGELTQITAYQVCAHLNVQGALPVIESAVQNGQTVSLQISAIGALGQLGGVNDLPLLQNLLKATDERLQLPLQTAIQRIEQRTGAQVPAKSS